MRVLLSIAYDGTDYSGWQRQNNAKSVQETVEKALSQLYGVKIEVLGASRTDKGVHALDQKAGFTIPKGANPVPVKNIQRALKAYLPKDIVVFNVEEKDYYFHPIADAKEKLYSYTIWNDKEPNPLYIRRKTFVREPLDVKKMNEAAAFLVGTHDFTAFSSIKSEARSSVRRIFFSEVIRNGKEVIFYISGEGFLYNMVRIIAGTLIEIGQNKRDTTNIKELLVANDRLLAAATAPPNGLVLEKVKYGGDCIEQKSISS